MNLNAYDDVSPAINKQATWIDIKKFQLLSREIKYRKYVTISKRFNKETSEYDYFVILLDNAPINRSFARAKQDDYGRIKINIASIWKDSSLKEYKTNANISIEHIDSYDDGDVYKLDV